jgi:hypothetical protein
VEAKVVESNLDSPRMDDIAEDIDKFGDMEMFDRRLLGCFVRVLVHLIDMTIFVQFIVPAGSFKNLLDVFGVDVVLSVSVTDPAFECL